MNARLDPSPDSIDSSPPPFAWGLASLTLGLPLCVIALQLWTGASALPDRVASHFNGAGQPDGWMGKSAFLVTMGSVAVAIAGVFLLISWLMPRMPVSLINMNNKEYWFAPERRRETLITIMGNLFCHGFLALGLMSWMIWWIQRANAENGQATEMSIWVPVAVYLVGTFALVGWMFRRFRLPAAADLDQSARGEESTAV